MAIEKIRLDCDLIYLCDILTDAELGELFKYVLAYAFDKELKPLSSRHLEVAFIPIKLSIDHQKRNTGKGHWNWKDGITEVNKAIRNGSRIAQWRKEVFERDNYTCQKCNIRGGILHAHHIKPFALFHELRFDVDNGLTLCKSCHDDEHRKEVSNG